MKAADRLHLYASADLPQPITQNTKFYSKVQSIGDESVSVAFVPVRISGTLLVAKPLRGGSCCMVVAVETTSKSVRIGQQI
eukprot:2853259-Amphidinium_carterae.2